jgi:hypothetical protein
MKTPGNFFRVGLIIFAAVILASCEKLATNNTVTGTMQFAVSLSEGMSQARSAKTGDSAVVSYQIIISVTGLNGNSVFTDKLIPLYTFGTLFVSENIEIKTGEYKLTKFMVINPSGVVVYAAPLAGSPLAYLTTHPLPFSFNIHPNQVTKVLPEVLPVNDQTPDQFGYASFGMQIIKPLDLWTACIIENSPFMSPTAYTNAKLTVSTPDGWRYTFGMEPAVNHFILRGGPEVYTFVLIKDGYLTQTMQFTAGQILATTKENPLILKIPYSSLQKMIVLQPGPEKGKDAMISNLEPDKNFGDHKYFEATFLSEPVLTVMRSNRSLIWFNLDTLPKSAIINRVILRLYYDIPIPFDSSFITAASPAAGIAWYGGVLQQVIEPWDEYKVTWNTQPKTTEVNQVYVAPFIKNANVIELNVTGLFVSPVTSAAAVVPNYGMLFRLWPVDKFPGFRFASSDYPEANMRPVLTIYYTL